MAQDRNRQAIAHPFVVHLLDTQRGVTCVFSLEGSLGDDAATLQGVVLHRKRFNKGESLTRWALAAICRPNGYS